MAKNGTPRQMLTTMIEDAKCRVEHPLPGESREHRRDNERQQDESTGKSLAAEITVEQHGQPQPERQLEDGGHARIDEGVVNGSAKDPIIEDLVEVSEADEVAGHTHARVGDRQQDAAEERIGDKHAEQHQGRHQQHECEPTLVLEQPEPGPRRLRHVNLGFSDRHFASPRCARQLASHANPRDCPDTTRVTEWNSP